MSTSSLKKSIYGLPAWYVPALCTLVIAVFGLIALGGSVRIMKAGLACPDWPLCFGDIIPDYHPQVYFEFIHRVVAGFVSIATAVLFYFLVFRSHAPRAFKVFAWWAVALLLTQVVMGGLTVLLQLHSKVVAAHLMMGTGFFAMLLWLYLSFKDEALGAAPEVLPRWASRVVVFVFVAIYAQIFLGGLVASHFAALVCTDFPTCQGQWIPTLSGIVGLHVIHRLGAYSVFVITLLAFIFLRRAGSKRLTKLSGILFALVCVQVCVGIANVLFYTPPLIVVIHLAVGTALLSVALRQLHLAFAFKRSPAASRDGLFERPAVAKRSPQLSLDLESSQS